MSIEVNYPIGLQSFSEIRTGGYVYVDKTQYIIPLMRNGKYKFLSRPRRFGKSLLISMLEAFFKGERELFAGLAISKLMPNQWEEHPVVHLDFSGEDYSDEGVLESKLHSNLKRYEEPLGLASAGDSTFSERFRRVVTALHETYARKVVVLIDEYDNPITSAIGSPQLQERFRNALYGFYSSLKSLDDHLHFCLLTGVTKYGHLSVFNGLNNLMDISSMNEFAGICGITSEEMHTALRPGVQRFAEDAGIDTEQVYAMLKDWYDGYHFSKNMVDVFNPYSVMNALARGEMMNYWYQTGAPAVLVKSIMNDSFDISKLNGALASEDMLNDISAMSVNPIALCYQTGYLTLKAYDPRLRAYTLGYPNKEVESGLMRSFLNELAVKCDSKAIVFELKQQIESGNVESFVSTLKTFFAKIPYDLRRNVERYENYYHSILYVLLRLIGMDVEAEYHTSEGSIDVVMKTAEYIYIIELKINGTATDAIRQINERNYSQPFLSDTRCIIKLGIGFAESSHTIDSYLIER